MPYYSLDPVGKLPIFVSWRIFSNHQTCCMILIWENQIIKVRFPLVPSRLGGNNCAEQLTLLLRKNSKRRMTSC